MKPMNRMPGVGDRIIMRAKIRLDRKTFLPANSIASVVKIDEEGVTLKFDRYHKPLTFDRSFTYALIHTTD